MRVLPTGPGREPRVGAWLDERDRTGRTDAVVGFLFLLFRCSPHRLIGRNCQSITSLTS